LTCYSPLKGFENIEEGGIVFKRSSLAGAAMEVKCGQCIGCRIDRSKEWAARIVHESQMHPENCFITLTYNDENLPHDGGLDKEHFQKFMKRLRRKYETTTIRYFHCGEYGQGLDRPHYHACLFGIDFSDRLPYSQSNDIVTYVSDELTEIWGKGFTTCGDLNYQTAAYTARYILKKVTGNRAEEHYQKVDLRTGELYNIQPEYVTMSLKPGIGRDFYEKYKTDFFPSDECPIPGKGVYKSVPKYYEQIYEKTDPNAYAKVKKARKLYRDKNAGEYKHDRLMAKYKVKKAQLSQLPRT